VEAAKRGGLAGFWVKWGWIRDMGNFAYTKHKCVGDFCSKWGGFRFRGVYQFVSDVRWVSGIVERPNVNANALLVSCRDFKFGVSYEGVEGFIPLDEEPGVVDEFKGKIPLGYGVDAIGGLLRSFVVLPKGFS
jgi:hypothetical protein